MIAGSSRICRQLKRAPFATGGTKQSLAPKIGSAVRSAAVLAAVVATSSPPHQAAAGGRQFSKGSSEKIVRELRLVPEHRTFRDGRKRENNRIALPCSLDRLRLPKKWQEECLNLTFGRNSDFHIGLRRLNRVHPAPEPSEVRKKDVRVPVGCARNRSRHLRGSLDVHRISALQALQKLMLRIGRRMLEIRIESRVVSLAGTSREPHHILGISNLASVRSRNH